MIPLRGAAESASTTSRGPFRGGEAMLGRGRAGAPNFEDDPERAEIHALQRLAAPAGMLEAIEALVALEVNS